MQRGVDGSREDVGRDPRRNLVLRAMLQERGGVWNAALTPVQLRAGQVLYEPGQPIDHVHFPLTCVVSAETVLSDGQGMQVAMLGHEGLVGMPALMTGASLTLRAVVLCGGHALRADVGWLAAELRTSPRLRGMMHQLFQGALAQIAQTAACRRHHSPEEQLCSLLLLASDRTHSEDLELTHDQLAHLLGVRRETVTQAAIKMQAKGLVRYRRGRMHITDRLALRRASCECYDAVNRAYASLQVPATVAG